MPRATVAIPYGFASRPARVGLSARLAATVAGLALFAWDAGAETVVYRVNCGGPAVVAIDGGPAWSQDMTGAGASPYVNIGASGDNVAGTDQPMGAPHASVPAWVPLSVFADERWDGPAPEEMRWEFPVTTGTYAVRLMMAEGYNGTQAPGARVFDIACEGAVRLGGFDMYALYGGYTPGMASFVVSVADGGLSLELRHGAADDPSIRGIEIVALTAPGVLGFSRGAVNFGTVVQGHTSPPEQVTLTNLGGPEDPSIAITEATIGGPFAHTLTPQTLSPGQSRVFNITFAPAATGAATGSLVIEHGGTNPPISIALAGEGVPAQTISFGKSALNGSSSFHPTSLQFGPDGRLYVAQQDGLIRIYSVQRNGPNQYAVNATEVITSVQALPNHNDDGSVNPGITTRLVTGLLVRGTPSRPVIYVSSSDPRMNVAGDINLDTNSGTISRLTWNGASWDQIELVRGLPRSENDHAVNGLALDSLTHTLYLAIGGATNMGAPSNNFSFLPEYALSAAILSIDLDAIGETTYDLPTLDDEDRPGTADTNDPFGGNDGRNQARLVPGGPVQVYSPGWRNPYDVLLHTSGRMYSIDNGPNAGWGGPPIGEGPGAGCSNADNDSDSQTLNDNLHLVTAGFYAGHPNPTRASVANTFNATNPQSPVPAGNSAECDYLEPGTDGSLASWGFSTNGLVEYRAGNFGGAMLGNLLAVSHNNAMQRVGLDAEGDAATLVETLFANVNTVPLDVTAQGDGELFRGTIWTCDYVGGSITVYEPADYDTTGFVCSGEDNVALDEDGDGFSNADEIDNGVSPCSAGDLPPDFDGDFLSDLNDPDDDNDGLSDAVDAFAIDATNGATSIPLLYSWDGGDPGFGLLGLGFTGLMANGTTDYRAQFDPAVLTAGGAAGKLTIDAVPAGDARGALNDQRYAFQFGVTTDATTGPFVVRSRVSSPYFNGAPPAGAQSLGIFIGDGGDDDYLKLVVTGDAGVPALEVVHEVAGEVSSLLLPVPGLLAGLGVDLLLDVDPAAATVRPRWAVLGQALSPAGPPIALTPGSALHAAVTGPSPLAAGIVATSRGAAPFTATWDFFQIASSGLVGVPPEPFAGRIGLLPAYPNPTTGGATLRFRLAQPAHVRLALYDLAGARVRTLSDGPRPAGDHTLRWDGRDAHGRAVPAGMYFQRLEFGTNSETGRIAVVR